MDKRINPSVTRIVVIYALASSLWIFASDRVLGFFVKDPAVLNVMQTYKGWFFVLVSSILLFVLLIAEKTGRQKIETALQTSQESFSRLFANNPAPMWVYDPVSHRFQDVNEAALEKFGYSRDEFLAMDVDDLRSGDGENQPDSHQPGSPINDMEQFSTKDQRALTVKTTSHSFEYADQPAILVVVEDISDRAAIQSAYQASETKRITAENRLSLDVSVSETLLQINQFENHSQGQMVNLVLEKAVQVTSSQNGYIIFLDEQGKQKELTFWPAQPGTDHLHPFHNEGGLIDPAYLAGPVIEHERPIVFNDQKEIQEHLDIVPLGFTYARQIIVPSCGDNRVFSFIAVGGKEEPYNADDIRHVSLLIEGLCRSIEHNRMVEELRESRLRLATAVDHLPFDFYMLDQNGRYIMQNEISRQMWGNLLGKIGLDASLPAELRSTWKNLTERVLKGEVIRQEISYPGEEHLGTFYNIIAPIKDENRTYGLLGINVDVTALKQREHELETIVTIAAAFRKTSDVRKMLSIVLDQLIEKVDIDSACIVNYLPETREFSVELARGQWVGLIGSHFPAAGSIIEEVITSGNYFLAEDLRAVPNLMMKLATGNVTAGACIPLVANEQTVGAIWVGGPKPITQNDLHLLLAIADIAANAIRRATLNEQTMQQLHRLTALRAIDLSITTNLDMRITLEILLNEITSEAGVDAAIVTLYQKDLQVLQFAASRGFRTPFFNEIHLRLGEGFAGQVALERKMRLIPDLQEGNSSLVQTLRTENEQFRGYLALPLVAKGEIKGVLELFTRNALHPSEDWINFLQAIASQAAIAIDNAQLFDQLQTANLDLTLAYDSTIEGWSRALELRDRETEGHTQRVTDLTMRIIKELGISPHEAVHIRRGVLLHDIGKMGIPDHILLKPGPLTEDEWKIMRKHPEYAYKLLYPIPYLRPAIDIPYNHHERWDGKGYPRGLVADEIPLPARVFTIIDNWDALTSDRPYRSAWPYPKVIQYLTSQSSLRFDPEILSFFLEKMREEISTSVE